MGNYTASAGSKIEYSTSASGVFSRLLGILTIPEIGDEPNKIDTTTLDNLKYESEINGLMPAPKMTLEFNMEDPDVNANINKALELENSGNSYYWKITKSNGIVHSFKSKVRIGYNEVGVNQISAFKVYLAPEGEIETTVPTGSI